MNFLDEFYLRAANFIDSHTFVKWHWYNPWQSGVYTLYCFSFWPYFGRIIFVLPSLRFINMNAQQRFFFAATVTVILVFSVFGSRIAGATWRAIYNSRFFPPLDPLVRRGTDSFGSGSFGASRAGHAHKGQDYLGAPGQRVYAPIGGRVTTGAAYADGRFEYLRRVTITGDNGERVSLMYVLPGVVIGGQVEAGDVVGTLQTLQNTYPGIPNHLHVEVALNGVKVDPAPFFQNQNV